jgi:hypothetical protein
MLVQVALVSQSASIASREVAIVSAALQKQVTRDFAPIWEVQATVDSFEQLADVPLGYWAIIMRDDVRSTEQAEGIHKDKDGQPFALVQAAEGWSLTASHECLEMLADHSVSTWWPDSRPRRLTKEGIASSTSWRSATPPKRKASAIRSTAFSCRISTRRTTSIRIPRRVFDIALRAQSRSHARCSTEDI